jgi:hypothetical protein
MKAIKTCLCIVFWVLLLVVTATAHEKLLRGIVRHHDFFLQLRGYSGYLLNDVEIVERDKTLGIVLLSPEGFEQHIIFEIVSMTPIFSNARILNKNDRESLIKASIDINEVYKLATATKNRIEEMNKAQKKKKGTRTRK